MGLISVGCLMIVAGCSAPEDGPSKEAVTTLAEELGEATLAGDYGKIVDHTYPGVVNEFGGREAGIEMLTEVMRQLKDSGVAFKKFEVLEVGEFHAEGGNTFVVVPTRIELATPEGRLLSNDSYLLGISPDGGETWAFVDGAGMGDEEFRDKVLPELPAGLKLPESKAPELIGE